MNFLARPEGIQEGAEGVDTRSRPGKTRVQLDLPPRSMERLHDLKNKTEASSYAEVLKNALRLYEAIVDETLKGNEFLIRYQNDEQVPYKIFV